MIEKTKIRKKSKFARNWPWMIGFIVLMCMAWYFSEVVTYLLVAWVLSLLGRPLMNFFKKRVHFRERHLGNIGATILTILSFYIIIAGLVMLFVPTIIKQVRNLTQVDYAMVAEKWREPFADFDASLHNIGVLDDGESLGAKTNEALQNLFKPGLIGNVLGSLISTVGNLIAAVFSTTFILFFFLKEKNLFFSMLGAIVPDEAEPKVQNALEKSSDVLSRYFTGLTLQMAAFSTLVTILLLVMGIKNALLIGLFGGLLNIVPYVGPILGLVFGELITISSNIEQDISALPPLMIKVAAAFIVTQTIDNNFTGPMIFSNSVKAHPLEIFLVTLLAAKLGGVVGMIIGVPVYTVLRVLAKEFFNNFKLVKRWTGHLDEEENVH